MKDSKRTFLLSLFLAAGAPAHAAEAYALVPLSARATAGSWDEPYVLIQSARRSALRGVERATIVAIDDMPAMRRQPLSPGLHLVEVSVPGPRGMGLPGRRTIVVDARACTRYYLGAKRDSRMSRDWQVVVDQAEPIGECEARFAR